MAVTQNTYTGDGSTVLFSFTFPYLETTDIKVSLDGSDTTAYTLANATTIEFDTAPSNGVAIRIYRVTDDAALASQFYPGSAIRSQDLNDNFTQNLYVTQESNRDATAAIATADAATVTANSAVTTANSAVATANTASTNASAAVATANTASSNASAAVSTANTASTNATTAVNTANTATATANSAASDAATAISTANGAVTTASSAAADAATAISTANTASSNASSAVATANTASTNATNAVNTANSAVTTANSAVTTANSAVATANSADSKADQAITAVANALLFTIVANVAAIPSSPADGDAIEITDSTGIESFTPLSGVPSGFVGDSGLGVRLVYDGTGATWVWLQYFPQDPEARYGDAITVLEADVSTLQSDVLGLDTNKVAKAGDTMTGNLTAPAFIPNGGTAPSNGLYLPATNSVALSTNGGERLRITSTGLVGIGSSSPGDYLPGNLVVAGGNQAGLSIVTGTAQAGLISFADGTSGADRYRGSIQYDHSNNSLAFATNALSAVTIDSSQRVGIGTTSPAHQLVVGQNAWIGTGGGAHTGAGTPRSLTVAVNRTATDVSPSLQLLKAYTSASSIVGGFKIEQSGGFSAPELAFYSGTSTGSNSASFVEPTWIERARIDSAGRLLVGTSSARSNVDAISSLIAPQFQIEGTTAAATSILVIRNSVNSDEYPRIYLAKTKGASVGSNTTVASGDDLGELLFNGADGTNIIEAASIKAQVDGTPGTDDMPGRLVFSTTADGASSPTPRVTLDKAGNFHAGTAFVNALTATAVGFGFQQDGFGIFARSGAQALNICRRTNDGELISFFQAATQEGSISVSGTTVSYNGAHLSRWSQLSGIDPYDKTVRPEILRGTVMSNLDEMCDWTCPTSGDCQDNEQLNKTKISDVEGDKNVAGVFQSWDDDDDTWVNDFYLAMTGDFVIRIAAGTTVQRGDLLMSAGDGTAKPQDDDIIRSKTIAKVTSTNVSCTHPDGSYCVPCVLMAC